MNIFLRYLMSLVAHLAWQRMGRRGPVPPVRIPGKPTVQLPVISSWQLMAALWVVKKIWGRYGQNVKGRLLDAPHPWAKQAGSLLPDPVAASTAPSSPVPSTSTTPPTVAPPMPSPTPAPPANHDTQPLPQQRLAPGSVLSSLNRGLSKGTAS